MERKTGKKRGDEKIWELQNEIGLRHYAKTVGRLDVFEEDDYAKDIYPSLSKLELKPVCNNFHFLKKYN